MFQTFYQLREQPFGANPDPRFLYLSRTHREAFASLLYRIQTDSAFLAMIAQPGMGKTTLLFHLLQRFQPMARTAFIFQTKCNSNELLRQLLSEFDRNTGITDRVQIFQELKSVLLAEANAGRRCVVMIDEAQNLDSEVLETVRLLSDFETPQRKLVQVILSGQSELGEMLARVGVRQLRQRLSCIVHIERFTPEETALYVAHRLKIAGYEGGVSELFSLRALTRIARLSEGIPRVINNICFNALSLGFALERKQIEISIVEEVAHDLGLSSTSPLRQLGSTESLGPRLGNSPAGLFVAGDCEEESEALAAITAACSEHEQAEQDAASQMQLGASTACTKIEPPPFQAQEQAPVRDTCPISAGASDGLFILRPEPEAKPETTSCAQIADTASVKHRAPVLPIVGIGTSYARKNANGSFLVRGCACALLLCIRPAADISKTLDMSDKNTFRPAGINLRWNPSPRALVRSEISSASGASSVPLPHAKLPTSEQLRAYSEQLRAYSEQLHAYSSEMNLHGRRFKAWKLLEGTHNSGVPLSLTSIDSNQLLDQLVLNPVSVTGTALLDPNPATSDAAADHALPDLTIAVKDRK